MVHHVFEALIFAHIVTGVTGAICFWVPVVGRKGGEAHRRWGRLFTLCLLITGSLAIAMSLVTLIAPMETHPHLVGMFDAVFIRGIFGWLMLNMGVLTVNLAWYGWLCAIHRRDRDANREWRNILLQPLVIVASLNCLLQGWLANQPLMMGLPFVGIATGLTNLWYLYKPNVGGFDWQKEHAKALVGGGISVYTAFMAFGSVRIMPSLALHPGMWAIPLVIGVAIILYHWRKIDARQRPRTAVAA
jgi:hypothetical protein